MTQLDDGRTLYYRHSGRTPLGRLALALLTILPLVALAGAAYAMVVIYLPMLRFVKLVLILVALAMAGFAFGVGGVTGRMLMWARVRNLAMVWLVAALAAVVAWYTAWVTWEWHLFTTSEPDIPKARFLLALLMKPSGVWFLATEINHVGTFGIGGGNDMIKGPFLWILWLVEAGVVLGVATVVPYRMLRSWAFCESCQQWCRTREGILSVGHGDEERLRARLALKDLSALEELGPADMSAPRRLRVDLQNCPACDQMHLLSVNRVDVGIKDGKPVETVRPVIDRLWLDPEQARTVEETKERLYAGPPAAAAPYVAPLPSEALSRDDAGAESSNEAETDEAPPPAPPGQNSGRAPGAGMGL
jgi:hypothetical protein